jgi:hypothetical protein
MFSTFLIQQIVILALGLTTNITGTAPKPRNPPAPKLGYVEASFSKTQSQFSVYSLEFLVYTNSNSKL